MTLLTPTPPDLAGPAPRPVDARGLQVAAAASLGAGAVHAAAVGAHGDHRQAVLVFTALALAQLAWGGLALARRSEPVVLSGLALAVAALLGWAAAKAVGLPVDGLQEVEPVQWADLSAALLAGVALVGCFVASSGVTLPVPVAPVAVALALVASAGTVATSGHEHAGHEHTGHEEGVAQAGAAHAHAPGTPVHDDGAAPVHAPVPYDPALPIDLSGTPGVTPQQQAAAERLVTLTLARLPRWSDPAVALRSGFRSIGDGFTGTEHLVNEAFHEDAVTLDPDRPESLVYDTTGGGRRLVAAMYMLPEGTPLSEVPDVGGTLVQWHTHEDLCYGATGRVRALTDAAGRCAAGLSRPVPSPMVHVWITPHRCGPFAALEGIGGGRVPDGEVPLCDLAHGAHG